MGKEADTKQREMVAKVDLYYNGANIVPVDGGNVFVKKAAKVKVLRYVNREMYSFHDVMLVQTEDGQEEWVSKKYFEELK